MSTLAIGAKELAKKLKQVLSAYYWKFPDIHNRFSLTRSHSTYLDDAALLLGFSDFNQYRIENASKEICIKKLTDNFHKLLNSADHQLTGVDIAELTDVFIAYLSTPSGDTVAQATIEEDINRIKQAMLTRLNYGPRKYPEARFGFKEVILRELEQQKTYLKKIFSFYDLLYSYSTLYVLNLEIHSDLTHLYKEYVVLSNVLRIRQHHDKSHFRNLSKLATCWLPDFVANDKHEKYKWCVDTHREAKYPFYFNTQYKFIQLEAFPSRYYPYEVIFLDGKGYKGVAYSLKSFIYAKNYGKDAIYTIRLDKILKSIDQFSELQRDESTFVFSKDKLFAVNLITQSEFYFILELSGNKISLYRKSRWKHTPDSQILESELILNNDLKMLEINSSYQSRGGFIDHYFHIDGPEYWMNIDFVDLSGNEGQLKITQKSVEMRYFNQSIHHNTM